MNKIYLFTVVVFYVLGCAQNDHNAVSPAPVAAPSVSPPGFQWHKTDTLSSGEKAFLGRLKEESDVIVWSTQVERCYKADSTLLFSQLIFPEGFLQEKGYVYFVLGAAGSLTDAHITYNFSMGQAYTGYGSVTGEDSTLYIHSVKSCGVTACAVQLFENGKKVYEKLK